MKTRCLIFINLFITTITLAQTPAAPAKSANERVGNLNNTLSDNGTNIVLQTTDNRYAGLVGTPYFIPNWSKAQVTKTGGVQLDDVPLKYNAVTQSVILRRPAMNDSLELLPAQIERFVLFDAGGQPWPFRRFPAARTTEPGLMDGFFLVLYEGKTLLLKRVNKLLKQANFKGAYSPDERQDTFLDDPAYYLLRPDMSLVKIKKSLKGLAEALSPQQDAVKAYAAQEKIGGKTDLELARLVQYADGLN
jgi:hypothetical protein